MSKKHVNTIAYSAPVCVTLAGHDEAQTGGPVLMMADEERVRVQLSDSTEEPTKYDDPFIRELSEHIEHPIRIESSLSLTYIGAQAAAIAAAVACALHLKNGKAPAVEQIQQQAYQLEKKLLKNHSHAQTTVCCQGGLLFYRKEFEFYKTVLKIPAKLPSACIKVMNDRSSRKEQDENVSVQKYIGRLVYAITHEDIDMFAKTFDESFSDIPDELQSFCETHKGVMQVSTS